MKTSLGLADWLAFQSQQHPKAIDLGLDRVRVVANTLGLLSSSMATITVAGTNGKGSSTAMLSAIYTAAGYRTGWFSSPHLLHYGERIRINGQMASDAQLIEAFVAIDSARGDISLTYFEWGTLAALWLFNQEKCDLQVLEVGLGGRLDATNMVDADAALITPIDIDHQEWLGSDRDTIAIEKAGILRAGAVAVTSDPQAPTSLIMCAEQLGLSLRRLGHEYSAIELSSDTWQYQHNDQCFSLPKPALNGAFQMSNAAGVVDIVMQMQSRLPVTHDAIDQGLTKVNLLGRMQWSRISGQDWLVDVAHNPQSIAVLAQYLQCLNRPVIIVFSALADKDIHAMVSQLSSVVSHWCVAPLNHERGATKAQLTNALLLEKNVQWYDTIDTACDGACDLLASSQTIRLICGSFVTVEQGLLWMAHNQ